MRHKVLGLISLFGNLPQLRIIGVDEPGIVLGVSAVAPSMVVLTDWPAGTINPTLYTRSIGMGTTMEWLHSVLPGPTKHKVLKPYG